MLTRSLRRSLQREEGQALVLASLTVLVLSVAVITTVNIGHTVHEKVRLQNTADAAAYSMAAMEARAFNFYAFTNRTQASHYVNAMIWQSIISFVYFMEAFLTDLYGMLKTLNPCIPGGRDTFWQVACPIAEAIPYLGPVIRVINRVVGAVRTGVRAVQRTVFRPSENVLDRTVGKVIIPGHRLLNSALASASTVMTAATMTHLVQTSFEVIEANDANVNYNLGSIGAGLLATCMFNRTHYQGMPRNAFAPMDPTKRADNNKIARAKRVMGQVANASRYACAQRGACPELFVTSRTFMDTLQLPPWLRQVGRVFGLDDGPISKWGQTRLLSYNRGWGREVTGQANTPRSSNFIHTNAAQFNTGNGVLGQGDNLGADDLYQIKLGPARLDLLGLVTVDNPFACKASDNPMVCHGDNRYDAGPQDNKKYGRMLKTSVWASNRHEGFRDDGGIHWRLQYDSPHTSCRQASCGYVPARAYNRHLRPAFPPDHADAELGLNKIRFRVVRAIAVITVDIDLYVANIRGVEDGNHPWPGLVPFPHFEPGQFASACPTGGNPSTTSAANRQMEFNQPSTFVALNKNAAQQRNPTADNTGATSNDPALLNDQGILDFKFSANGRPLSLKNDKSIGIGPLQLEGLTVVSRGQAYYHRPGNWAEQPNFFNPYWRPRLASVWQGRYAIPVVQQITSALPAQVNSVGQKILTH